MRKIGEVLRLKSRGMNNREIARSTGAGKTTVYEYLARAEAAGLSWPLPPELDEAALEARLRSTLVASQLPVDAWHGAMADPTLAEAILDRLVHQAHRITVKGPSMRRREPEANPVA